MGNVENYNCGGNKLAFICLFIFDQTMPFSSPFSDSAEIERLKAH